MRCLKCQPEIAGEPRYCSECGYNVKSGEHILSPTSGSGFSAQEDLTAGSVGKGELKPPSGFSRTLSTELVGRQSELRTLLSLSTLIENRTYKPGEVMIHKGEMDRDLFFLTEGLVEISRKEGGRRFYTERNRTPIHSQGYCLSIWHTANTTERRSASTAADWICILGRRHHPHEHDHTQDVGVTHRKPGSGN